MPTYLNGVLEGGTTEIVDAIEASAGTTDLSPLRSIHRWAHCVITFTGASAAGLADVNVPVFGTSGGILVHNIQILCNTDLTGAASILSFGTTTNVAAFIANTTATTIDAGEFWVSAAPTPANIALPAACQNILVGDDIVIAPSVADCTGGVLLISMEWSGIQRTLSSVTPTSGSQATDSW